MKCQHCSAWTRVVDSRRERRRRECGNGHRFSTVEVATSMLAFMQHQRRVTEARRILRKKGYLK